MTGVRHVLNQDRFIADGERSLFAVADGMGGMRAGDRASQMVIDLLPDHRALDACRTSDRALAELHIGLLVTELNQAILTAAQRESRLSGMGTTLVLAMPVDDWLIIASVGDSRAYLARNRTIEQLTTDHTLAQMLVEAGTISQSAARVHRFRNLLWKHLGSSELRDGPDVRSVRLQPGDQFALVTDGVTNGLRDWEIATLMNCHATPEMTARTIVTAAVARGTHDDATCVVLRAEASLN